MARQAQASAPAANANAVVVRMDPPRLPVPEGYDVAPEYWRVLVDAIWPGAKSSQSVVMAIEYCKARNLDPMKRCVHIVSMYSRLQRRTVETVWPGIIELETTAARTQAFAGVDEPRWGPIIQRTFRGSFEPDERDRDQSVREVKIDMQYHEWCAVTVYRLVGGVRCAFTEPVYWEEAYAKIGRTELPNEMWQTRWRGQHQKCARAAALRQAFPEEIAGYAAEEMEGRTIDAVGVVIDGRAEEVAHTDPTAETRQSSSETSTDGTSSASTTGSGSKKPTAADWLSALATALDKAEPDARLAILLSPDVGRALKNFKTRSLAALHEIIAKHRPPFQGPVLDPQGDFISEPYAEPLGWAREMRTMLDEFTGEEDRANIRHHNADALAEARLWPEAADAVAMIDELLGAPPPAAEQPRTESTPAADEPAPAPVETIGVPEAQGRKNWPAYEKAIIADFARMTPSRYVAWLAGQRETLMTAPARTRTSIVRALLAECAKFKVDPPAGLDGLMETAPAPAASSGNGEDKRDRDAEWVDAEIADVRAMKDQNAIMSRRRGMIQHAMLERLGRERPNLAQRVSAAYDEVLMRLKGVGR